MYLWQPRAGSSGSTSGWPALVGVTILSPFSERLSGPKRFSPSTGRWSSSAVLAAEMSISRAD